MTELDDIRKRTEGHTPGPWIALRADEVEHDHKYKLWESLEGSGKTVLEGTELSLWEATIPDALLIAAAPDLRRIATEQEAELTQLRTGRDRLHGEVRDAVVKVLGGLWSAGRIQYGKNWPGTIGIADMVVAALTQRQGGEDDADAI